MCILDDSKEEGRNDDLDIVPSGKVSERTSAFESKPETTGSPKLSPGPVLKRSESNLTSDMQKKYQVRMTFQFYITYLIFIFLSATSCKESIFEKREK